MLSTSGRSSRSTLMLTNRSFITAATAGSSNDSCAITWHQWHAEYPTLNSTGLFSACARANASSPHGYQSTGLSLCCRRYGLVSSASRFMQVVLPPHPILAVVDVAIGRPRPPEREGTPLSPEKIRKSSGCSSLLSQHNAPILQTAQSGSGQGQRRKKPQGGSRKWQLEEALWLGLES